MLCSWHIQARNLFEAFASYNFISFADMTHMLPTIMLSIYLINGYNKTWPSAMTFIFTNFDDILWLITVNYDFVF